MTSAQLARQAARAGNGEYAEMPGTDQGDRGLAGDMDIKTPLGQMAIVDLGHGPEPVQVLALGLVPSSRMVCTPDGRQFEIQKTRGNPMVAGPTWEVLAGPAMIRARTKVLDAFAKGDLVAPSRSQLTFSWDPEHAEFPAGTHIRGCAEADGNETRLGGTAAEAGLAARATGRAIGHRGTLGQRKTCDCIRLGRGLTGAEAEQGGAANVPGFRDGPGAMTGEASRFGLP